jgi:acyl dehydratase
VPVTRAEADAYDSLTLGVVDFTVHPPGPNREAPVSRLYLLALLSKFDSEMNLPGVATNRYIANLNYGYDDVTWHTDVYGGALIRDEVTSTEVEERDAERFLISRRHTLVTAPNGLVTATRGEPVMTATSRSMTVLL